jgi:hypothetical protein
MSLAHVRKTRTLLSFISSVLNGYNRISGNQDCKCPSRSKKNDQLITHSHWLKSIDSQRQSRSPVIKQVTVLAKLLDIDRFTLKQSINIAYTYCGGY